MRTTSNCLGSKTFRSKITGYGDFRNGATWPANACRGTCDVVYGGQYATTSGFAKAGCSGNVQQSTKIGFWCHAGGGDASVIMIGGGGDACDRADHGLGITEKNDGGFSSGTDTRDFGSDVLASPFDTYALNLWISKV